MMKRRFVRLMAVVLVTVMALGMSACGDSGSTAKVAGEEVTVSDICDNRPRYMGKPISVGGKIERIDGPYYYNDTKPYFEYYVFDLKGGWTIWVDDDDPLVGVLSVGDQISAEGYIKDAWTGVTVCGRDGTGWCPATAY